MRYWIAVLLVLGSLLSFVPAAAQNQTVQCGDIVEGEFIEQAQRLNYVIELSPGDTLEVQGSAFGTRLGFMLAIFNSANEGLVGSMTQDERTTPETNPVVNSGILSSSGQYTIQAYNARMYLLSFSTEMQYQESNSIGSIGAFTLGIRCILRDGTVIEPGQTAAAETTQTDVTSGGSVLPAFSGFGFAGLPSVDFSGIARLPLPVGIAMGGAITPTGGEIIGYTFDASEGSTIDLTFTRASGNLNIGMVILFGENQVVYQSSLINTQSMNAVFSAPFSGTYTVGLYRVDLLPPAAPEATAFQLQVSVQ